MHIYIGLRIRVPFGGRVSSGVAPLLRNDPPPRPQVRTSFMNSPSRQNREKENILRSPDYWPQDDHTVTHRALTKVKSRRLTIFFQGDQAQLIFLVSLRLTEKGNERQNITFSWRRYIEIFWSLNLSKEAGDGLENVTHRMPSDWKSWRSIQGFWCLSIPEFQKSNKRNSWRVNFNSPFACEPSIVLLSCSVSWEYRVWNFWL